MAFSSREDVRFDVRDSERVMEIGAGSEEGRGRRRLFLMIRRTVAAAREHREGHLLFSLDDLCALAPGTEREEAALALGQQAELANFEFVLHKTPPREGWSFVRKITLEGAGQRSVRSALERGRAIGEETNKCRALANTPGGDMTPAILAREARKISAEAGVRVTVMGPRELARMGMGGVLGVSKGSAESPRFIVMEYKGSGAAPIVLAGKGVTFDTGGLNIKPGDSMYEMHMDMSGGAAVMHAVALAARLKMKKRLVALVPAVENMTSGSSYRPGDIIKSYSGKTIEVLNTDAEGRIILADALWYARSFRPSLVIDVATLTGAAVVALGQRASAVFTEDEDMERLARRAGEESGDLVWPLPLWREYDEEIRGTFGDVANIGKTRYGGAITAAAFLRQFTDGMPWMHVDIAPRLTSAEGEFLAKGSPGAPVPFLIRFLELLKEEAPGTRKKAVRAPRRKTA